MEIRFLKAAFDAKVSLCQRNVDQTVMHAEMQVGDSLVMLGQANDQWQALQAALHVWVPDVDAVYAKAIAEGGGVTVCT